MRVAVLGLGEAGSLIAADLARAGDEVQGYDPAGVPTPQGVKRHARPDMAADQCELVLAVTPGSQARAALDGVLDVMEKQTIYADLSTGSPGLKLELAGVLAGRGPRFVDVALMSPVPGHGLNTPAMASGSGAQQFADSMNARGGDVEVVGDRPGEAATRKLLRSVVMKGVAALLMESMEAAQLAGKRDWLWGHLVDELTTVDAVFLRRLLHETSPHAGRRLDEMKAAQELLAELGVPGHMTSGTIAHLERLIDEGMPDMSVE
jgi:3-hydroxyisobutyrate dehydrogenase-like beta-hydroxyacid dehydrogenase